MSPLSPNSYMYDLSIVCVYFLLFRDARWKCRHKHFKTRRWPLGAIFFFLLDSSVSNAFILFKDGGHPNFENHMSKEVLVTEILSLLGTLEGRSWAIEDALSLNEDGERRFIFDEIFPFHSFSSQLSYSEQGNELEDCYSTKMASLSREEVEKRRLVRSLRHWSIRCDKRAPCILHKKRLRTNYHCLDCGIPLHPGVCHRIFHSVSDLSSVYVDEKLCN